MASSGSSRKVETKKTKKVSHTKNKVYALTCVKGRVYVALVKR